MFRAVIFDFDGVITDSEILHFRSFNQALSFYECRITKEQYYRDYLGLTDVDLFKLLVDEGSLDVDQQQLEALLEKKKVAFEKLAGRSSRPRSRTLSMIALAGTANFSL